MSQNKSLRTLVSETQRTLEQLDKALLVLEEAFDKSGDARSAGCCWSARSHVLKALRDMNDRRAL